MTATAILIAQLRVLAHLSRARAQGARLRVPQASGDDVRAVLRQSAADADEHAARLAAVLHDLGALPDPIGPVLGRVAALVRSTVEQAQPLDEALLGDLTLEHQLRDRARYVAALADVAGLPAVRTLADDLDATHTAHIAWLTDVLVGLADGETTALDPSPLQQVAAQVTRAANAPRRGALDQAAATVRTAVDTAVDTAVATAAQADAAPDPAVPDPTGPHPAVPDPTVLDPTGPPVPGFADLPAHAAIAALRALEPADVAAALAFEQAHGNRPEVVAAARVRARSADR